ncbi:MAG: extracellular solute-binding protein [Clostridia bacterium]|nr:extracellular solute-binding protein [Clostridia bacterium]
MKKRILALLFTVAMLFTVVSCENVEYIEPVSKEEESIEQGDRFEQLESMLPPIETEDELPQERDFRILTSVPSVFMTDEDSPKTINTAVEKRNELIKKKYGANIKVDAISEGKALSTIKSSLSADNDIYDMFSLSAKTTVSLYLAGLLTDMNTLPDFSLDSEFMDGEFSKTLATGSSLYLLPDATTLVYEDSYVMFFNRDLILSAGAENPESLAMQGVWTWDKFNEIARKTANDVYNHSSASLETDTFGFGAYYDETTYPMTMWVSTDTSLISDSYKNPVEFTASIDDILEKTQKLRSFYNTKGKFALQGDESAGAFEENRIVFYCNKLEYLYALRDGTTKGSQFGILPIPKYSEDQEGYSCLIDNDAMVLSVPFTVQQRSEGDKRFVSAVILATCAASKTTVKEAFIDYHIAQYLNSNDETVMLQLIADSAKFDFGTVYGSEIREVRRALTAPISDYLSFGSGLRNSFANAMSAFKRYCSDNFK